MARVRPHVKVHISVADHRKTSAVWADLAMRGMLVELWRKAGEKYAGRTADRVSLKPTDRMDIAATTNQAEADQAVTALCSALRYELRTYPNRWDVRIRKFSKKQGWRDEESQQLSEQKVQRTSASESESESYSDTNTNTEREKISEAPPAPPAVRAPRARSPKSPCPDSLPEPEWSSVLRWASGEGHNLTEVAREWDAMRDHWRSKSEQRADWSATFRTWLRNAKRFAARDARVNGSLSPAQAKAERTKDAGRQAYELLQQRKLGLIEGGQR